MTMTRMELDADLLVELNEVLDQEQRRVEITLTQLDDLRSAVIRRDEAGLQDLMARIQARQNDFSQLDQRRQHLRQRLAEWIGCGPDRLNLTRLIRGLPPEQGDPLRQRQQQVYNRVRQLKMEHHLTGLLLADCARMNRMLLRMMLGGVGDSYNAQGQSSWQVQDRLVSVQM
jgi:hypothetical protein